MGENKKFDCICRICTDESEGINIYSEEGKKDNLEGKIRKYLYISVYVEDNLPKMVCQDCKTKLDDVHQFATMAVKMQEKLKNCVKMKNEEPLETSDSTDDEHGGSLLHSILTKGQNCSNGNISASESPPQSEVTEVEVRIDPMLFLCDDTNDDTGPNMEMAENGIGDTNDKSHDKIKSENDNINSVVRISQAPPPLVPIHSAKDLKPYKCTVANCPRGFNTEIGLQNHLWCHSHAARKVLSTANLNSKRRRSRRAAFLPAMNDTDTADEQVTSNSQSFLCPMCGKSISTKGNLKVHLETHRPKGKYGCDICGRIFKTQSNLYRHKEYHGGVQYPCLVCGRVYPTNSTLRAHSITHSTLRPHKCPLCEKTFKRNQDLKFHINQHTGARPYQCPYCPKAFASSGNCFSHRKRMHPTEVERDREMADEIAR